MNHLRVRLKAVLSVHRFYHRPPILGVLGHVDHGKTTLIDSLRKTNNVSLEAGGITQRNSIFQHTIPENNYKFTIVDTPGHAAFSRMRATGTSLTDAAILVVDAKEGVKQQTRECIKLLRANEIPIVVALNKIDLEQANPENACEMLFDEGVETTLVGGDVPAVPISALKGIGLNELMLKVKSVTDKLNLKVEESDLMDGIIFDIQTYMGNYLTTVLVRKGSVRKGDRVICDDKRDVLVRDVRSVDGTIIEAGLPGMPILLNGPQHYTDDHEVGGAIFAVKSARSRKQRLETNKIMLDIKNHLKNSLKREVFHEKLDYDVLKISFLVVADTTSTLEIIDQMLQIDMDGVKVSVFSKSVRKPSKEAVQIAERIRAPIILFNVPDAEIESDTAIVIRHNIIYDLAREVNHFLNDQLPINYVKTVIGKGKIAEIWGDKKSRVVGVNNLSGTMDITGDFIVKRGSIPFWEGRIATLKYMKEKITKTAPKVGECGIKFPKKSIGVVQPGDRIECTKVLVKERQFISPKFFGSVVEEEKEEEEEGESSWTRGEPEYY